MTKTKEKLRRQTAATKKKLSVAATGKKNSQYDKGQRSYRTKMGLKTNDGKMVHHRDGNRANNSKNNLQIMKSKGPERSKHEKIHQRSENWKGKGRGRQKMSTTAKAKRLKGRK